jgi:hypothetical protein
VLDAAPIGGVQERAPMDKKQILEELRLFSLRTGGVGNWLTENTDDEVFARLAHFKKARSR